MIIEFVGTPGSGKTTLLPMVSEALQERAIHARSLLEAARPYAQRTSLGQTVLRLAPRSLQRPLLWQVFYHQSSASMLRFAVKHRRLLSHVLVSQARRPIAAKTRERRVVYWFCRLVGSYEFLSSHVRTGEALLFDEGFIHRVVQLNASPVETPNPAQVCAYVDLLPRPDLVIHTQADPEVCQRRIYHRGIWEHFRASSRVEVAQYLESAHSVVNMAVDRARTAGWKVIDVDNSVDDPYALRAKLRDKLKTIRDWPQTIESASLS